jgi:hypothetical protein
LAADSTIFTGKLVRKYYQHIIPQAIEQGVFGWFLELDSFSKVLLQKKMGELKDEDRRCCLKFEFDSSFIQLCLAGSEDRMLCRHLEGKRVEVLGEWPSSPHMFRPIPSYQLHLKEIKQIPLEQMELHGVLFSKIFPGPPNYDSVEDGDYPEVGWILKLDDRSRGSLSVLLEDFDESSVDGEIAIEIEKGYENVLQQCTGQNVMCLGNAQSAENAHHPTPFLLRCCKLIAIPE